MPANKVEKAAEAVKPTTGPGPDLASGISCLVPDKLKHVRLFWQCVAELYGTALLVIFGVGSVMMSTLTGGVDLAAIILLWGLGITFAIYCVGSISGGHLNPAVSFAFALLRPKQFRIYKLPAYVLAQFLGAIIGAAINYSLYKPLFAYYEEVNDIRRDSLNGIIGASTFGMYFPNPGNSDMSWTEGKNAKTAMFAVSSGQAFWVECWATALLMALILGYTDSRQALLPTKAAPVLIGFTIAALVGLYAPLTQAGMNPARDMGPRLVAHGLGWGDISIPGPDNK